MGLLISVYSSCGPADPNAIPRTNLITGSTGSSWYRIGSAIAERTNHGFEGQPITAIPGAGGVSNPARVGQMPGDLGLSFIPFLRAAYQGDPPYPRSYPELRHVATLLRNKFHVVAAGGVSIGSLGDIGKRRMGLRIGTGPPGSGEEFLLKECLSSWGVTYEDIRSWGGRVEYLGSGERADLFRDNHIDIITFHAVDPSSLVTELMLSRPARLLSIPDDVRDELDRRWGVKALSIVADTYPTQSTRVETAGLEFGLFTTADVSEDLVYALVKTIAENKTYLESVHIGFETWEPRDMPFNLGVPQHPGAIRYYRERGWIDP
jgi:TRAP transporter TAXI family solute receptor